ncbi:MAG: sensor domain-containing diguanylate cyclase [Burkholderiaceae bacterium]|nr:sensor domain-containing diguanylate cyclase [Burkholderiaceae bacterium]MDH3459820.1 sensor domain-containing diguanylate cyclase [Burkholderiaceae bacterium]
MNADIHPLLLRQLRKLGLDASSDPPCGASWAQLLERVSRAYIDADQDRYLMDRSQELSSHEMAALNAALQASQRRLASLVSLSSDWIWEQDAQGHFTYFSDQIRNNSSLVPSVLLGARLTVCSTIDATPDAMKALDLSMQARQPFCDFTFSVRTPEGWKRYMRITGEPIFEGDTFKGYLGVGSDVTQTMLAELQFQRLALYDGLTELPNRVMLMDELDRALKRSRRHGGGFAVFFIDLDHFKRVNDSLGHAAGDQLLKQVAARLRPLLREADMLARLGGDEFVLLVEGCINPAELSQMAKRALAAIAEPLSVDSYGMQVSASIGIGVYPTDGHDAARLLKSADTAMYLAKKQGRNTFRYHTAELAARTARDFALER